MKKVFLGIFAFFSLLSVTAVGGYATYDNLVNQEEIYSGISVNGVDVSGLNGDEALEKVTEEDQDMGGVVYLYYGDNEFSYSFENLGYNPDYKSAIEEALDYGREGTPGERFRVVTELRSNPLDIKTAQGFENRKLNEALDHMAEVIYMPPKDAGFTFLDGEVIINKEEPGRALDREKTKELMVSYKVGDEPIEIPTVETEAVVKEDYFASLKGDIGHFSTNYTASVQNRKDNIKLAASIIDGTLIMPGEQISFNEIVGDISPETGFKPATVILDGEYSTGTGGGICQVSTTLYNAAVRADLQIDERRNHSRPVNYVGMGLDAAVASGFLDLKLTNTFDFPVYIRAVADEDNIEFTIIGDNEIKDYDIELVSERTGVLENSTKNNYSDELAEGVTKVTQSGNTGYTYTSYKVKTKNGEIIARDNYLNSYYPARDTVITIGTKSSGSSVEEGGN